MASNSDAGANAAPKQESSQMTTMTAAEAAELEAIMAAYKNVLALPDLETIEEKPNMHDNDVQYDVMRDSLVRYLGYANEVGESFKGIVPKLLMPSYVVAYGYALTDSVMKGLDETKLNERGRPVAAFCDTLLWQSFASVLLPGLTINRVVAFSTFALAGLPLPPVAKRWIPVTLGLSAIPAIIKPIDDFVESMMNRTVRRLTHFEPRHSHQFSQDSIIDRFTSTLIKQKPQK